MSGQHNIGGDKPSGYRSGPIVTPGSEPIVIPGSGPVVTPDIGPVLLPDTGVRSGRGCGQEICGDRLDWDGWSRARCVTSMTVRQ